MKRILKDIMEIIKSFAEKHDLRVVKVRREIEKALSATALKGLCDAEFFVETLAFMIAKELKKRSYR